LATEPILQVAVPSPVRRLFDYLPPNDDGALRGLRPGMRVRVPFGGAHKVGLILAVATESAVPAERLRRVVAVLDSEPVVPEPLLDLVRWAAGYYHHPPGEVVEAVLPRALRGGRPATLRVPRRWRLTASGAGADPGALRSAPRQAVLLGELQASPEGLTARQLASHGGAWRPALRALVARGWVAMEEGPCLADEHPGEELPDPPLNRDQGAAVAAVLAAPDRFQAFLLDGVTGSGKTEVYLRLIREVIGRGRQALVLVPEIALTPQLMARFRQRLRVPLAILHSGLSDQERLCAWLAARDGRVGVVVGTRSAVFVPLARPGLFVVDEEHDLAFKQQDGFRYSARDLCVVRARSASVPVILGTATPSLESLYNATRSRYRRLVLPERAGPATPPQVELLDVRALPMNDGLSPPALRALEHALASGGQVLVFINRRGYAPTLTCHQCGWVAECHRCDAHMVVHQAESCLRCHHCTAVRALDRSCPACGAADLRAFGQGTERVEAALRTRFPDVGLVRIDRDSTRRRGSLERKLADVRGGTARILIGTQMLAKGHHFPDVILALVLNADAGLYSADFRAGERMAQLIVQVAGRAGRAERPGRVLVQTHHPQHPYLRALILRGYHGFCDAALAERRAAGFPPFAAIALLRAEAPRRGPPEDFLEQARACAEDTGCSGVELCGPVPAPMERRAGRFRAQLMVVTPLRGDLQRLLARWLPALERLPATRRVRWSLDVDPQEVL
jgi:primosomal protein N' (replication factor Y)